MTKKASRKFRELKEKVQRQNDIIERNLEQVRTKLEEIKKGMRECGVYDESMKFRCSACGDNACEVTCDSVDGLQLVSSKNSDNKCLCSVRDGWCSFTRGILSYRVYVPVVMPCESRIDFLRSGTIMLCKNKKDAQGVFWDHFERLESRSGAIWLYVNNCVFRLVPGEVKEYMRERLSPFLELLGFLVWLETATIEPHCYYCDGVA